MLGSPRCEVCGKVLGPRASGDDPTQVTCSAKCRGIRWRQRRDEARRARDRRVRDALRLAREAVDEALRRLGD